MVRSSKIFFRNVFDNSSMGQEPCAWKYSFLHGILERASCATISRSTSSRARNSAGASGWARHWSWLICRLQSGCLDVSSTPLRFGYLGSLSESIWICCNAGRSFGIGRHAREQGRFQSTTASTCRRETELQRCMIGGHFLTTRYDSRIINWFSHTLQIYKERKSVLSCLAKIVSIPLNLPQSCRVATRFDSGPG